METSLSRGRAIIAAALVVLTLVLASGLLLCYLVQGDAKLLFWLLGVPLGTWGMWRSAWQGRPAARCILVLPFAALGLFGIGLGSLVIVRLGILGQIPAWAGWAIGAALLVPGLITAGAALVLAFSSDVGHYLQHRRAVMQDDLLRP